MFFERFKPSQIVVIVFFIVYFLVGIAIYRDYGMSWDEPTSRDNGIISYEYVTGQNKKLLTYRDRDYGTAFELPLVAIEKIAGVTETKQIYLLRHLVTFLLFFTSAIFFYKIAAARFGRGIGFLGVLFLVLSPRIFADSFYNSKDIALLSAIIIAIYTLLRFTKKPSLKNAIIHALACAFVVAIRIPGMIILPLTMGVFTLDTFLLHTKNDWKSRLFMLALFVLLFCGFVVLIWPYLWSSPLKNFVTAFSNFSHFNRLSDSVLYMGGYYLDKYVPWHYPLVWIGITTPLAYLLLFLFGVITTVSKFSLRLTTFYKNKREDLIFLFWFFAPLIMVIGLNSSLYDGWRQLYFIYPGLILVALIGFEGMLFYTKNQVLFRVFLLVIITFNLLSVLKYMIVNHPYQNLYFNPLVEGMSNTKKHFEMDYWGLTFRRGLEYIAIHDKEKRIPIYIAFGHEKNIDILPPKEKKRFEVVPTPQEAKYILVNYRWYKDKANYRWDQYIFETPHKIVYSTKIDGVSVMTVLMPDKQTNRVQ